MAIDSSDFPKVIELTIQVRPDFYAVSAEIGSSGIERLYSFSIDQKLVMVHRRYITSSQPTWSSHTKFPFVELEVGLCYFENNKWNLFDDKVQKAYSDFVADKELLDDTGN